MGVFLCLDGNDFGFKMLVNADIPIARVTYIADYFWLMFKDLVGNCRRDKLPDVTIFRLVFAVVVSAKNKNRMVVVRQYVPDGIAVGQRIFLINN